MTNVTKKAKVLSALDREKLYSVEEALATLRQLLTEANFAQVQPGMAQAAVGKLLGRHARELRYATKPGETVWRWHVQRGQDKKVFDVTFDTGGRVLSSQLGDDERQTQPGG